MPGHRPQTQRQTFNTLQALLGRRSWAMGLGPGPDGAQPTLGEVTVTNHKPYRKLLVEGEWEEVRKWGWGRKEILIV